MKISFALFVLALAILLNGCETNQPLMTDEAYDARHPPAPHASDRADMLPQSNDRMSGRY
jgi:hypothetical protein